jgi:hypothetical protein
MLNTMFLLLSLCFASAVFAQDSEWTLVSATYFGGPGDYGSHPAKTGGNCRTMKDRQLTDEEFQKFEKYFAAPDDGHPDLFYGDGRCDNSNPPQCPNQKSCGKCFEVACVGLLRNEYRGMKFQETIQAKDYNEYCKPGVSVVVGAVDSCPGSHSRNQGPNWCQRLDEPHLDLSYETFQAITEVSIGGQMYAAFRQVECNNIGPNSNGFKNFEEAKKKATLVDSNGKRSPLNGPAKFNSPLVAASPPGGSEGEDGSSSSPMPAINDPNGGGTGEGPQPKFHSAKPVSEDKSVGTSPPSQPSKEKFCKVMQRKEEL